MAAILLFVTMRAAWFSSFYMCLSSLIPQQPRRSNNNDSGVPQSQYKVCSRPLEEESSLHISKSQLLYMH